MMTHTRHARFICTLSLVLACLPVSVSSQGASGSLNGVVTDAQGALIPRARVVARLKGAAGATGARIFETETSDQGTFQQANLPSGVYEVQVRSADFEAGVRRTVSVPRGKVVEVTFELGRGCDEASADSSIISAADRAEVVRLTLIEAISSKVKLLNQKQRDEGVVLSTKNLRPEWVKGIAGVKIKLLSQPQIQRQADLVGDFPYLSFPEVRVRGNCIAVTIANTWAVGRRSRMVYLSGGGYTYEYRKELGKWTGKFVSGWVS